MTILGNVGNDILFCRIGDADSQWVALWGSVYAAAAIIAVATILFPVVLTISSERALTRIVVGCGIFQAGHFAEHAGQMLGLASEGGLTLTIWAQQLVYGFSWIARSPDPHTGLEMMHFFGDLIYLCGVIAWRRLHPTPLATGALIVQGVHQIEHTYLVTSALLGGTPVGLTTVGPIGLRIVMHFTLNFGGSVFWALSVWEVYRDRLTRSVEPANAL